MSITKEQVQLLTEKLTIKLNQLATTSPQLVENGWNVDKATSRKIKLSQQVRLWADASDSVKFTLTLSLTHAHIRAHLQGEITHAGQGVTPSQTQFASLKAQLKLKQKTFPVIEKAVDKFLNSVFWKKATDVVDLTFARTIRESALERASYLAKKSKEANPRKEVRIEVEANGLNEGQTPPIPLNQVEVPSSEESPKSTPTREVGNHPAIIGIHSSPELWNAFMPSKEAVMAAFSFQRRMLELMVSTQAAVNPWLKPF